VQLATNPAMLEMNGDSQVKVITVEPMVAGPSQSLVVGTTRDPPRTPCRLRKGANRRHQSNNSVRRGLTRVHSTYLAAPLAASVIEYNMDFL
jgi:hypothetical protein